LASIELYDGLHPHVLDFQEGTTSGSFEIGDLVKTDSSGQVVIATAGLICGIARKKYTGTAGTTIPVELISFEDIYSCKYSTTTAQSIVGDQATFTFTAGAHVLTTDASGTDAEIVGLHPGDAVGTSGGRVLFRFLKSVVGR